MGIQVQQQNNILPTNISIQGNKFSHLCWDNFDINEETPSGAGTTHSTHGIIIQEIIENHFPEMPLETVAPRAKDRKLTYTPTILPPCFAKKRVEPTVTASTSINKVIVPQITESFWVLCIGLWNANFTVPDWAGWISRLAEKDDAGKKSVIGYMEPILFPITDYSTVQQCLVNSQTATRQLQQTYTFVTMDLAAAKIGVRHPVAEFQLLQRRHNPPWCIPHHVFIHGCIREAYDRQWI